MAELTQDLSNKVAQTALRHYHNDLPQKAKPKDTEWTVYAAIVAVDETDIWVVSSATGTKCCVVPKQYGANEAEICVLTDCHAEVSARRGLHLVLLSEMKRCSNSKGKNVSFRQSVGSNSRKFLLEQVPSESSQTSSAPKDSILPAPKFRLKENVTLHLYVSDSPCGDASIYSIQHEKGDEPSDQPKEKKIQFTGAKVVVSEATNAKPSEYARPLIQHVASGVRLVREQRGQHKGKLRTKSGRSNLEPHLRSQSMSCSDKIARWAILGLQGGILEAALQDPIRLSTIVVSQDPRAEALSQVNALKRSIVDRAEASLQHLNEYVKKFDRSNSDIRFVENTHLPSIFVVDVCFPRGKSSSSASPQASTTSFNKKRKRNSMNVSASGHCSNWQVSNSKEEIVIGARGLCQGPKPKSQGDYAKLSSRLCRRSLAKEAASLCLLDQQSCACLGSYRSHKRRCMTSVYRSIRKELFTHGPLAGWLIGDGSESSSVDQPNERNSHSLQKRP